MCCPGGNLQVVDGAAEEDWSDRDLVSLIRGGGAAGRDAERALCERYARRIHLYGVRHLREQEEARELVQQVLVVAIESIRAGKLEQPDRLASFILGTCRFVTWDLHRDAQRRHEVAQQAAAGAAAAVDPAWERIDLPRLERCMGALPARELTVVRMTYQEDRSAEEVATALALNAGHVRVIRHRALRQLQACLEAA
jgi:RNA polymerase sigma-70 factor (ECF subfamily)